jgi:hypothetical protein
MMARAAAAALLAIVSLGVTASGAGASCAITPAVDQLRQAPAAFIGRLVERQGDRLSFAVEERVKGALGDRVVVRDAHPMSSIALNVQPGRSIGLFLRGDPSDFHAHDCDVTAPETMRAAALRGDEPCARPRILRLRVLPARRGLTRVEVRARTREGKLSMLTVSWGDGYRRYVELSSSSAVVRVGHRYSRRGRHRLTVRASAGSLPPECGHSALSEPATRLIGSRRRRARA